jgi:transposase, IS30 family
MAKHLSKEERFYIEKSIFQNKTPAQIARELQRSKSSITREISRNSDQQRKFYLSLQAENLSSARQKKAIRKQKMMKNLSATALKEFNDNLAKRTSPEQISTILLKACGVSVSHQTMYRFIEEERRNGGKLYKHLRRKGRRYRYKKDAKAVVITNKKSIEIRPNKLSLMLAVGHWEIDTVYGKDQKSYLLTLVDIASMYTIVRKISNREAKTVELELDKIIKETGITLKSITSDNGGEFANHINISKKYNIDWYFCHPYCSGERGLNENTNGLIRDFLPKGTDFRLISDEEIQNIQNNLNNRPRKRIGFARPVYHMVDMLMAS